MTLKEVLKGVHGDHIATIAVIVEVLDALLRGLGMEITGDFSGEEVAFKIVDVEGVDITGEDDDA